MSNNKNKKEYNLRPRHPSQLFTKSDEFPIGATNARITALGLMSSHHTDDSYRKMRKTRKCKNIRKKSNNTTKTTEKETTTDPGHVNDQSVMKKSHTWNIANSSNFGDFQYKFFDRITALMKNHSYK